MNVAGNDAVFAESAKWASDYITSEHKTPSFLFSTGMILSAVLALAAVIVLLVWWFWRKPAPAAEPPRETAPRPTKNRPPARSRDEDEEDTEYVDRGGKVVSPAAVRGKR